MAALSWLALAAALVLVPLPTPTVARVRALAGVREQAEQPVERSVPDSVPAIRVPGAPERVWYAFVVAAGGGFAIVLSVRWGIGLGVAAVVAMATGSAVVRGAITRRRSAAGLREDLVAVRQLRAEIEAGALPEAALASGSAPPAALHAFRIAETAGVPFADALAGVDRDLEARAELGRAVAGAVAGARASAALLAGLPLLGLLLGAAMGAHPLGFLTGSGPGRLVCCVGVLLDAAGVAWTQRLAARAERAC